MGLLRSSWTAGYQRGSQGTIDCPLPCCRLRASWPSGQASVWFALMVVLPAYPCVCCVPAWVGGDGLLDTQQACKHSVQVHRPVTQHA